MTHLYIGETMITSEEHIVPKIKVIEGKLLSGASLKLNEHRDVTASISMIFANYTNKTLYVCEATGNIIVLPPAYNKAGENLEGFIVRREDTVWREGNYNMIPNAETQLSQIMLGQQAGNARRLLWEEHFRSEDILTAQHGVYLRNAQVYVTDDETNAKSIHHVGSLDKLKNDYITAYKKYCPNTMNGVVLRLICNRGVHSNLYSTLNGIVAPITATFDPLLPDGLYVTTQENQAVKPTDTRYDIDEVLNNPKDFRFPLYRSSQLANNALSKDVIKLEEEIHLENELERRSKRIISEHTRETLEQQRELEKLKIDADRAKELHKETIRELTEEADKNKHERDAKSGIDKAALLLQQQQLAQLELLEKTKADMHKYTLDNKTITRKSNGETFKIVVGVATFAFGIYKLLN